MDVVCECTSTMSCMCDIILEKSGMCSTIKSFNSTSCIGVSCCSGVTLCTVIANPALVIRYIYIQSYVFWLD